MVQKAKLGVVGFALALLGVATEPAGTTRAQTSGNPLIVRALPQDAIHRLGTSQWRHGSRILCLAYSPDGRMLAAGGGDDPVRLWDSTSGREVRSFPEPWVNAVAWSPRSSMLITAGAFKTIRLWGAATGKEIGQLKGHTTAIKSLAISPPDRGTLLASGGQDGSLLLWELETRELVTKFEGHTDEVNALAFSPNARRLASAGGDRSIRIWDTDNNKPLRQLDGQCTVTALAFLDNQIVASGGDDNLIRLWDIDSGRQIGTLEGHQGTIVSLIVSRDEKAGARALVSGAHDKTIRLWDVAKRRELAKIARTAGDSDALALSPEGKYLAAAGLNNTIRRWEVASTKPLPDAGGHQAAVTSLAMAPDGKRLASGSTLGDVRLWDPASGQIIKQWSTPTAGEVVLAFARDSNTLATAVGTDAVRLWDAATGQSQQQLQGPQDDPALSLAFGLAGTLAVGHRSGAVRVWDIAQSKVVQETKYPGSVSALVFAPDGRTLAASGSHRVVLYNTSDGQQIRSFGPSEGPLLPVIAALAFSPDGKTLATGSYDAMIRVWDTTDGKELGTLEGHQSVIYGLAFSADGRNLVSASFDKTVRLWEVFVQDDPDLKAGGKVKRVMGSNPQIAVWKGHLGSVSAAALAPDCRTAISGSQDTSLLVWDITGRMKNGKLQPLPMAAGELQSAWDNLAADNIPRGNRALWDLVAATKDSVPFLEKSVFLIEPEHLAKLLRDLDDKLFRVRDSASKELARYGRWVEKALRTELTKQLTEEPRRRVVELLRKLEVTGSITADQEFMRYRRAMRILEQDGGGDARRVLEKMSQRGPDPQLRAEAQACLDRLGQRQ